MKNHPKGFNPHSGEECGLYLAIYREPTKDKTTMGDLYANGVKFCETLEDAIRPEGVKVDKETCVPAIRYFVDVTWSNRFKRLMPIIYTEPDKQTIIYNNVKFVGCRLHGGMYHTHTEGCILVAHNQINDTTIQGSAEKDLTFKIMTMLGYEPVWDEGLKWWKKGPHQAKGLPVICEIFNPS
jgi:hypothetical protein